ncbi:MAG: hypothetical protein KDD42_01000 [Bdellovibrionales bacterium]|nr:hypothetical protein [Bdellovibrionales bacterium]
MQRDSSNFRKLFGFSALALFLPLLTNCGGGGGDVTGVVRYYGQVMVSEDGTTDRDLGPYEGATISTQPLVDRARNFSGLKGQGDGPAVRDLDILLVDETGNYQVSITLNDGSPALSLISAAGTVGGRALVLDALAIPLERSVNVEINPISDLAAEALLSAKRDGLINYSEVTIDTVTSLEDEAREYLAIHNVDLTDDSEVEMAVLTIRETLGSDLPTPTPGSTPTAIPSLTPTLASSTQTPLATASPSHTPTFPMTTATPNFTPTVEAQVSVTPTPMPSATGTS